MKPDMFYIQFEQKGGAGKSFAVDVIARMFGRFAIVNLPPTALKYNFNDCIKNFLLISFEEGETDSYTDKTVNVFIKG